MRPDGRDDHRMMLPQPEEGDAIWACPLLNRQIAEGLCLDINYERLRLFNAGVLSDAQRETGKTLEEINGICEVCPNQPLRQPGQMLIKLLVISEYEEDGWTNKSEEIRDPGWDQIERSIRSLDKYRLPFVRLALQPEVEDHGMFDVMGGEGDYWIGASIHGWVQRRYFDPSQGDKEIDLWTSDQGFADQAKYICHDIELVLRAVRRFCEKGDFEPSVPWEPDRHAT
jgi:hypothetical protein